MPVLQVVEESIVNDPVQRVQEQIVRVSVPRIVKESVEAVREQIAVVIVEAIQTVPLLRSHERVTEQTTAFCVSQIKAKIAEVSQPVLQESEFHCAANDGGNRLSGSACALKALP